VSNFEQFLSNFEQSLSTIEQFLSKIEQFFLLHMLFPSNAFSIDCYLHCPLPLISDIFSCLHNQLEATTCSKLDLFAAFKIFLA